jgi:hypothetical protein
MKNAVLALVTVVLCTAMAEGLIRWLDSDAPSVATRHLDAIALAPGVQRAWFAENPPPLPNRKPVPPEWRALDQQIASSGVGGGTRRADAFKAWNSAFVGDPCEHWYLKDAPGRLFVYDPPGGSSRPPYRFLPDATTPIGLVTNAQGFRGAPVPARREPGTVRIAFLGASTTVGSHDIAWSYPELVGNWLNLWAKARNLAVRFEVLNAGREAVQSMDIAEIMATEVAPLAPDLVVYYEGANQFDLRTVVPDVPPRTPYALQLERQQRGWFAQRLHELAYDSALARRLEMLLAAPPERGNGGEWSKPSYALQWPVQLDEKNPDLSRKDLPVHLSTIIADLDRIRAKAIEAGAEMALASFKWLVADGMVLDPERHRVILEYLNVGYAPFSYRDLERLANFQNRVLELYAASRKIDFLDIARLMPSDPDLFIDAIHGTQEGIRLQGWIALQLLIPVIDRHLADGTWPKKSFPAMPAPPPFEPRLVRFDCR